MRDDVGRWEDAETEEGRSSGRHGEGEVGRAGEGEQRILVGSDIGF